MKATKTDFYFSILMANLVFLLGGYHLLAVAWGALAVWAFITMERGE